MKFITVSGLEHQIAPYFVLHQLRQGLCAVHCITASEHAAQQLRAQLGAALLAADESPAMLERLHCMGEAQAGAQAQFEFLSEAALQQLFEQEASRHAMPPALSAPMVCLIVDRHHLPQDRSIDKCLGSVEQAMRARHPASRLGIYCLGTCFDDLPLLAARPGATAPLGALVTQVAGIVSECRRRSPAYFEHYALQTRQHGQQQFRVMAASTAAALLSRALDAPPAARNVLIGAQGLSIAQLLAGVAQLSGAGLCTGFTGPLAKNSASDVFDKGMAQMAAHAQLETADIEEAQAGQFILHQVASDPIAALPLIEQALAHEAAESALMARSFLALPQLRSVTAGALRYHRYGTGSKVLLLVNAFGLTLNFWTMLTEALGSQFSVIAVDTADSAEDGIATACYGTGDYLADYLAQIATVFDAEAIASCHVISWCSGAKFALELARAFPATIASLSLVTPSFAGMGGFAGADSAYEKNLLTMCKLVEKSPKSAGTMAKSMMAIMEKGGNDMARFDAAHKDYVNLLELADQAHLPHVYRPFASPDNLIAFSAQLMRFRSHDVTPLLARAELALPVMLITGRSDTTTSSARAQDICSRLPNLVAFDIEGSGHYVLHQNYRLIARLVTAFIGEGLDLKMHHYRVQRSLYRKAASAPVPSGSELVELSA